MSLRVVHYPAGDFAPVEVKAQSKNGAIREAKAIAYHEGFKVLDVGSAVAQEDHRWVVDVRVVPR